MRRDGGRFAVGISDEPNRIITFLFTDIEGSTSRWEANPSAMEAAVRDHDEALAAAISRHDGRFVKQTGDGVFAAFDDPAGAVAAAVEAQEAFSREDWGGFGALPVRIGLHSGLATHRTDDYFGNEVIAPHAS